MKFLRDLFMGPTNKNWDIARVVFGLAVLTLMGGTIYNIAQGHPFEAVDYANAFALMMAGGGFVVAAKDVARKHSLRDGEDVAD